MLEAVPTLLEWMFVLVLCGGAPLLLLIALPFWVASSVFQGMSLRGWQRWEVRLRAGKLELSAGRRSLLLEMESIAEARWATNGNWTRSRLVEDALTLYGWNGRRLAKIPESSKGFWKLRDVLRDSDIQFNTVEVAAPAYLD